MMSLYSFASPVVSKAGTKALTDWSFPCLVVSEFGFFPGVHAQNADNIAATVTVNAMSFAVVFMLISSKMVILSYLMLWS